MGVFSVPAWLMQYLLIAGFVVAGLLLAWGVVMEFQRLRQVGRDRREMAEWLEQEKKLSPVIVEWRPTGRINMIGDYKLMLDDGRAEEPGEFVLLVEEKRLVADISGAPTLQTQWRKASRRDASRVVRLYNEKVPADGPGERLAERLPEFVPVSQQATDGFGTMTSVTMP